MLSAWLTPPIVPLLKVYVFNITNPTEVLKGLDPITEEIGPYVYSATHIRRLIEMEGESLQFKNKHFYKFLPELSIGSENDKISVLNMVMITAFNKARSQPSFVKSTVVVPLIQSIGRSDPLLNVTVGEFLFGYEEELACLGSPTVENDSANDDDDEEWDWDSDEDDEDWDRDEDEDFFTRRKKRSVPNYRDETGKCMWGMLRDLNNTEHETVKIETGLNDFKAKGKIIDLDGKTSFGAWRPECDSFEGSIEPSTLPAQLGSNFSILVPVMCRTLEMVSKEEHSIDGIPVTRYTADPRSMDQDKCYCPEDSCLPPGYLDLAPCYPDIAPPLAVSFPHGLHSPSNPLLTHPPSPDASKHSMFIDINNQLGVPLAVQVSFQLSAILRPDPSFPLLNSLNSTKLVPLFWAGEGFDQPNNWMLSHTKMALGLPVAASLGCAGGMLGLGLCLIVFWLCRR